LIVTYPVDGVVRGLGEEDAARPLEATLWGEPALGHVTARLADGTKIGWRRGRLSVTPDRPLTFEAKTISSD
jgi:hypothetical protein